MGIKVFVYGTLLFGCGNWRRYLENKAERISDYAKVEGFKMFNLGFFPTCIFTDNPEDIVYGEVYSVSEQILLELDHLECYPRWYDRININDIIMMEYPISMNDTIWIYVQKAEQLRDNDEHIPSGNWREYCEKRHGMA
jgi:gamma-glutamylcyclotransferase (GGCT)/AIG2-like uncharacterized protein YtfP